MPALTGIIETALHVDDIERSSEFYERVLELERIGGDDRLRAYAVARRSVLLLFQRGGTLEPVATPGGLIPSHNSSGQSHVAFSIAREELARWEARLASAAIPIESRVKWPMGGESIYFRDPDGHLLEIATPGLWSIY
jgi:catechol 2,3-dioxygenase-like lactoylglutathione lyase family enzyme